MKKLFTLMASAILSLSSMAVTPMWLRDVQISPDGQQILFCYKGDVYKVSSQGGTAIQLTTQDSYECNPIWSPDGKQVAFASDRNGNFDIFVMPAEGGSAKCLTTNSAAETPWTFSPASASSWWQNHPSVGYACRDGELQQRWQYVPLPRPERF